jgi:hypothetical protein
MKCRICDSEADVLVFGSLEPITPAGLLFVGVDRVIPGELYACVRCLEQFGLPVFSAVQRTQARREGGGN